MLPSERLWIMVRFRMSAITAWVRQPVGAPQWGFHLRKSVMGTISRTPLTLC